MRAVVKRRIVAVVLFVLFIGSSGAMAFTQAMVQSGGSFDSLRWEDIGGNIFSVPGASNPNPFSGATLPSGWTVASPVGNSVTMAGPVLNAGETFTVGHLDFPSNGSFAMKIQAFNGLFPVGSGMVSYDDSDDDDSEENHWSWELDEGSGQSIEVAILTESSEIDGGDGENKEEGGTAEGGPNGPLGNDETATAIPEPTSLLLLGSGLVGAWFRRKA